MKNYKRPKQIDLLWQFPVEITLQLSVSDLTFLTTLNASSPHFEGTMAPEATSMLD